MSTAQVLESRNAQNSCRKVDPNVNHCPPSPQRVPADTYRRRRSARAAGRCAGPRTGSLRGRGARVSRPRCTPPPRSPSPRRCRTACASLEPQGPLTPEPPAPAPSPEAAAVWNMGTGGCIGSISASVHWGNCSVPKCAPDQRGGSHWLSIHQAYRRHARRWGNCILFFNLGSPAAKLRALHCVSAVRPAAC